MIIIGIDLETTSLDIKSAEIIEIAAVAWDTERKAPVKFFSEIVNISPRILDTTTEKITGIRTSDLSKFGIDELTVFKSFLQFCKVGKGIVGHNLLRYDLNVLRSCFEKHKLSVPDLPMIDTLFDVPFPDEIKTRNLGHLAAEHRFLNPFPHRALFDVMTTLKILAEYDFDEVWNISNSDMIILTANVSFEEKGLAQAAGFHWSPTMKKWTKMMRKAVAEKVKFPFEFSYEVVDLK